LIIHIIILYYTMYIINDTTHSMYLVHWNIKWYNSFIFSPNFDPELSLLGVQN